MRRESGTDILFQVFYLAVAFALQGSLASYVAIGAIRPDLIMGSVVCLALWKGPVNGTIIGFAAGLFQDLSFGGGLGLHSLAKCGIGFGVGHAARAIYKEEYRTQSIIIAICVIVHDFIYFAVTYSGELRMIGVSLVTISLGSALYTAIVSPAYDYLMHRAFARKEEPIRETAIFPPEH